MTHKRALKFLSALNSSGNFRFSNKQPRNANIIFLEKSKYYAYMLMFLQKVMV